MMCRLQKIRETCSKYEYTFVEAKKPENNVYNRYMDICPYDHSRIIIKKGVHSYINANLVKVCMGLCGFCFSTFVFIRVFQVEKADKQYILTQGPTPASTPDFWRMVWECDSKAIIMLNKRIENDKVKCSLYWPNNVGPEWTMKLPSVGLVVELLTENNHSYYSTRTIKCVLAALTPRNTNRHWPQIVTLQSYGYGNGNVQRSHPVPLHHLARFRRSEFADGLSWIFVQSASFGRDGLQRGAPDRPL